jgi:hypothetical protein
VSSGIASDLSGVGVRKVEGGAGGGRVRETGECCLSWGERDATV